jgi:hypothetical protein
VALVFINAAGCGAIEMNGLYAASVLGVIAVASGVVLVSDAMHRDAARRGALRPAPAGAAAGDDDAADDDDADDDDVADGGAAGDAADAAGGNTSPPAPSDTAPTQAPRYPFSEETQALNDIRKRCDAVMNQLDGIRHDNTDLQAAMAAIQPVVARKLGISEDADIGLDTFTKLKDEIDTIRETSASVRVPMPSEEADATLCRAAVAINRLIGKTSALVVNIERAMDALHIAMEACHNHRKSEPIKTAIRQLQDIDARMMAELRSFNAALLCIDNPSLRPKHI